MKRENLLNLIGLALLLACFALALQRIASRPSEEDDDGLERIRFAHWQLEGGLREAFDQLAREYEALHPGVIVEQVAIPERTYQQWVRTQLIGETITEIVQLGKGSDDEMLARFFTPLTNYADQPNPYNQGTELADRPLRETILDGMQGDSSYRPGLLEYYGVPVSMFTVRMFYNRTLWRTLFGDRPTPANYDEFIQLCADVEAIRAETGRNLIPIAGSKDNAPALLNSLFSSQTQRLNQRLDRFRNLRPAAVEIGLYLLRGDWSLDDPDYVSGLTILREAAASFQSGYTQLSREDASFYFLQKRALMIATGSWDSPTFRSQADFDIGVFSIPLPTPEHPRFGSGVLGRPAEAETGTGLSFGVPRNTKNVERAVDFLRFLASKPGNTTFSRVSGWLPSVVGVTPDEHVQPFLPTGSGVINGFEPAFFMPFGNTLRIFTNENNALVGPAGSVENYLNRVRGPKFNAVRQDLGRSLQNNAININRQDVVLAALLAAEAEDAAAKRSELFEAQNKIEAANAWTALELETLASP